VICQKSKIIKILQRFAKYLRKLMVVISGKSQEKCVKEFYIGSMHRYMCVCMWAWGRDIASCCSSCSYHFCLGLCPFGRIRIDFST